MLAVAACVLVRLGRVWEDIRSLVLLVLLMFLAISVSLDEALTTSPIGGSLWLTAGLVFSVAVSEALLTGLRVRLPPAYRIPYYLVLALFFLYPLALAPWVGNPASAELQWGLFGFSTLAGLVFLTLLPGVRQGAKLVLNNGTPWNWPWYPLSFFFLLAVAICLRAYYLCLSLHFVGQDWSIFGSYFLVPFFASANVLWLELGMTLRKRSVTTAALMAPLAWLWLAQTGRHDDAVYLGFLNEFQRFWQATPLFMAFVLALVFFSLAALRRVFGALEACVATATAMSFIGPTTLTFGGPFEATGWPLCAAAALLLISAARRRESLRAAVAASMFVIGSATELRGTWLLSLGLTPFGEVVPLELLLSLLLLVGVAFRDPRVPFVRLAAALLLVWVGGAISAGHGHILGEPDWLTSAEHLLFWTCIAIVYAGWLRVRYFYFAAAANLAIWGSFAGMNAYGSVQARVAGLREIIAGLAFFILAFLVSVWKARGSGWRRPA